MEQALGEAYHWATAPVIAILILEHNMIANRQDSVNLAPWSVLARDIWNLRQCTNAPNSRLEELVRLNLDIFPKHL